MSFRIVIADDESIIRRDLSELLTDLGYVVVGEAMDGAMARTLVEDLTPDVIILDVVMPRTGGIKLAAELSDQYPIILLTAHSSPDLVQAASDAGVMAYLTKPFRVADIGPAITLAVSHFVKETELTERVVKLADQLETRKLVDRAKATLMEREGLSEADAYRQIQKLSMTQNMPMKHVAKVIIDSL